MPTSAPIGTSGNLIDLAANRNNGSGTANDSGGIGITSGTANTGTAENYLNQIRMHHLLCCQPWLLCLTKIVFLLAKQFTALVPCA
jgi:hypothetical protein